MNANGLYSGVEGYVIPGTNSGVGGGVANGVYTSDYENLKLLDRFPKTAVAYSLRKLRTKYNGPAVRVRRSSDNSELDIGFTSGTGLDEATLSSFVGAGNGFITTWYDQSTNGRNATQSTFSAQPRIVASGVIDRQGNRPALNFDGADDRLSISPFTYSAEYSLYQINKKNNTGNIAVNLTATGGNVPAVINHWSDSSIYFHYLRAGTAYYRTVNFFNNNFNLLEGHAKNDSRSLYANNILLTLDAEVATSGVVTQYNSIGSYSGFFATGTCSEILLFTTDYSLNRNIIVSDINTYYNIY